MGKLVWDAVGERIYETGVKNVVLYTKTKTGETAAKNGYNAGVAWNGATNITEKPTGAEASPLYADDTKYLNLLSAEEFEASIEAYTYPDEFARCDGSKNIGGDSAGVYIGQQTRDNFCLAYKTVVGNDSDGNAHGYKIHLIYNATAAPTEKAYATINDSPEAITFSWELKTTPVEVTATEDDSKPTANLIIDSTKFAPAVDGGKNAKLQLIEDYLFGKDATTGVTPTDEITPQILFPDDIIAILNSNG